MTDRRIENVMEFLSGYLKSGYEAEPHKRFAIVEVELFNRKQGNNGFRLKLEHDLAV